MNRIELANLPTRIQKLERLSKELNANIYIKRDDQTGTEWSGNKIRKLEYVVADAKEKGCDMLITCGGIQSNHARATVTVATYLGMKSAVLLRVSENPPARGNYFLDRLMGADVRFCTRNEYSNHRMEIMQEMADRYAAQGYRPYIVPEGASMPVGNFGYMNCMDEIVRQEEELGIKFDTIVVATGSGGTYAGLWLGNELKKLGKRIVGMTVCDDSEYFTNVVKTIAGGTLGLLPENERREVDFGTIEFNDKYVGIGYALSRPEELEFIKRIARTEAIVLDPVYTGKAMYGVWNELQPGGNLSHKGNILFIHTGGLFGLFPISDTFPLE